LKIKVGIANKVEMFIVNATSYSDPTAHGVLAVEGNTYTAKYPDNLYIVIHSTKISTGNFKFFTWYNKVANTVKPPSSSSSSSSQPDSSSSSSQ
jgi:hypothetical protein